MDWFIGDHRVEDFEFHVSDWLVAEGPLPRSPLESLYNGILHRTKQGLVHLERYGGRK